MTVIQMPGPKTLEADPRQQEAIQHNHGPMLVVAGAGTGKTTVLVSRIARLIREGHAKPEEIVALTYSDNAATEMLQRVQKELRGTSLDGLQAKTFHAYCNELLRRSGRGFDVLDDKDLWIMLRKRIAELHLNYFVRAANVSEFLNDLLKFMQRCQDELVDPERYAGYVSKVERGELPAPRVCKSKEEITHEEALGRCREIANVFQTVERMLKERNLGTFGHMITGAHRLFREDEEVLARERAKARFILVDEFQDANYAQIEILKMLAGSAQNVFAVGDPDQAIYRFRGASSAAFKLFDASFPDARRVTLGKNRRSRTAILQCAYALIDKNPGLPSKANGSGKRSPLQSARDEAAQMQGTIIPAPVETVALDLRDAGSSDIVNEIQKKKKALKLQWKDFAVLYRSHGNRDDIVTELVECGIPFSVENMDVTDTPEARDLFACVGAVVNSRESASLLRVAALPQFGIVPEELRAGLRALPKDDTSGVAGVLAQLPRGIEVLRAIEECRAEISSRDLLGCPALEAVVRRFSLDRSNLAIDAVLEFVRGWETKPLTESRRLAELIEYLDLFREANGSICLASTDDNAVRLMTAHAAKGLEFRHVFIIRANSNSFPSSYKEPLIEFPRDLWDEASRDDFDDKELSQQEERRLFYVAMTRACDSLTIYAKRGRGKKEPLPDGFMRDLLKDASLKPWLIQRPSSGFQAEMFAKAEVRSEGSRTSQWFSLQPASDLSQRLSASSIDAYKTCPLKFKIGRDWKLPSEPGGAMQFGATMHRILLAYYQAVGAGRPLADAVVLEMFETDLRGQNLEDAYQLQLYLNAGREQLKGFLQTARASAPTVLHTEEWFDVVIGGARISGRVDRIDQIESNEVAIVDYKTGKPQDQEDADESLQLSIYAIAAQEKWGYRAERLVLYNLVENQPVFTTRTEQKLQEVKLEVEDVAQKIAQNKFDAKPGFHCAWCAYRGLCPKTEKQLFPVTVEPPRRTVSS